MLTDYVNMEHMKNANAMKTVACDASMKTNLDTKTCKMSFSVCNPSFPNWYWNNNNRFHKSNETYQAMFMVLGYPMKKCTTGIVACFAW